MPDQMSGQLAIFSPQVADAAAIYRGIQLAIDTGLALVMIDSIAAVLVDWINGGEGSML